MKTGDIVLVHPFGSPAVQARAKVLIVSGNQCSAAFGFEDKPPWMTTIRSAFISPEGVVILAARDSAAEPWKDIVNDRPIMVTVVPNE